MIFTLMLAIPQEIQCERTALEELKIGSISMAFYGVVIYGIIKLIGNPSSKKLLSIKKDLEILKLKHKKALNDLKWHLKSDPENLHNAHYNAQWTIFFLKSHMTWLIERWNVGFINGFSPKLKKKLGSLAFMNVNDYIIFSKPDSESSHYQASFIVKIDEFIENFSRCIEIYKEHEREQSKLSWFKHSNWRLPSLP